MENKVKIIITGGGSGGHTMPAISMIDSLKDYSCQQKIACHILYIGSKNGLEKKVACKNRIDYRAVTTGKLRRYFSIDNFIDIFKVLYGILQCLKISIDFKPDLIFSTGGFVSVPPVIAGKLLGKKVIIHEQTIAAGLANKIAALFADKVALTFKESSRFFPRKKTIVTGIPLRPQIFSGNREKALKKFNFQARCPTLYFSGGGQGCHLLNRVSLNIIPRLLNQTNIIFQTGRINEKKDYLEMLKLRETLAEEQKKRFIVYDFITDEIGEIYAAADLVISRSGAGTVNELLALKKPALFIPLAIAANNEQLKNARIMTQYGGAVVIEEKNLTETSLSEQISEIIFSEKITRMKQKLTLIDNCRGNEKLLQLIFNEIYGQDN